MGLRRLPSMSLGTMFLFVAVVAVLLVNLRIVAITHRADVARIWRHLHEDLTGRHAVAPTQLRWSDTPGPPAHPPRQIP